MDTKELVIFRLADESYGIDIDFVENIEKHTNITRVPYTKKYIQGIINLRGNIIPVINVRRRFNLETKAADKDSRIMIVNYNELKVGLLVDASSEVLQIEPDEIEPAPKVTGADDEYVSEIGKVDGRIIMIIDLERLLELEEIEEL
ncbi:chemotaxis protein CheW [Acidaminobacter sp. JC074]|uniref:chemotaxis protein CheW n=1 Tax=Acidaminobacter sp. JC074 TaxID=2530199 RepID=UPI001F0F9264|nr:chemotaxis protein CheW [Acidaminobacter sp. JC074]MCH4888745.1 chemotaxis protein CheW [Acidaminobacter sp. JC074]